MFYRLTRFVRSLRRKRTMGLGLLLAIMGVSIAGNTVAFFVFERLDDRDVTIFDSLWYSIVSITTIGYGDFSAQSLGARLGTIFFIVFAGLTTFAAAAGILVDWIMEFQYRERVGMGSVHTKDHLLIINFPSEARVREIVEEFRQDSQHQHDDIVILTDQIESLPLTLLDLFFVRGSPLEEESYQRARIEHAKQAIVLSTRYDDPNSDSVVASIVAIIEYLNPKTRVVAECLTEKHNVLFAGAKNASLVHTLHLSNNLLVQEAQDPGVSLLTRAVTSNRIDGTLASTRVEDNSAGSLIYLEAAKKLLDKEINLIGVIRDESVHLSFGRLTLTKNDSLVYISSDRLTWEYLRLLLAEPEGPAHLP